MAREPFDLTQEQIDSLAQQVHSFTADEYTLKWGKQTSKYRNSCRREIRATMAALEHYGFKLERPAGRAALAQGDVDVGES